MLTHFIKKNFLTSIFLSLAILIPTGALALTATDNLNIGLTVTASNTGTGGGTPTYGLISGWVYHDLDANGRRNSEPSLGNWPVSLYQNGRLLSTVNTMAVTGIFEFNNLQDGSYEVCEDLPVDSNNWSQTDPTAAGGSSWRAADRFLCSNGTYGYRVDIANANSAYSLDFGNTSNPVVSTVPNVLNFQATPNNNAVNINLTWVNPVYPDLAAVRIVRLSGAIPADPSDGQLIYEGTGQGFVDTNVTTGVTYFYAAFVRSTGGQYSSGSIASAILTTGGTPPEEITPPGEVTPPGDIFDSFPSAIDTSLPPIGLTFLQPGKPSQIIGANGSAKIDGSKPLTIFLPRELTPPVLKTIGLTLFAPGTPTRSFTFLLRLNNEGTGYTATLSPLGAGGVYKFTLHIINYKDQRISRTVGSLVVSGVGQVPAVVVGQATSKLVLGSGLALGATQLLLVTTQAQSLLDIYLIFLRGVAALMGALGLRKKREAWGTVYDAVTKRPIDPALVNVMLGNKEVTSAITDIEGRYGFFLPAGTYTLKAGKTHYKFPSQLLAGKTADELYHNLYFGEPFTTLGAGEVITRDIPLDPVGFDWNEFVKGKGQFFKRHYRRELLRNVVFNTIYLSGAAVALYHALASPTNLDFAILAVYVIIFGAQRWWQYRYPVLSLKRASGEPLSYSIIHVFLPGLDQEVKKVITDELGRFYLLVRPGEYYFTVDEKMPDASYKEIYRSTPQTLKTGVLKKDLIVA